MAKKNKRDNQKTGEFSHSPFKALKGFSPKQTAPAEKPPRPSLPPDAQDEGELFLKAVGPVKRLDPAPPSSPEGGPAPAQKPKDEQGDQALFLQAMKTIGTAAFREEAPQAGADEDRRSPSSRMKQLRRGTIRIRGELDLHGFMKDEALRRLEHFLAGACARAEQAVLVITGKGINSPDGPVLQGAVAEWMRSKGKGMVAEFHPAPRDKGGSGAFVVFLKSRK